MNLKEKLHKYKCYFKELMTFSFPIIIGNIGHMFIGAGDIFVAGKYSTTALSALSIANAIIMTITIAGIGLLSSVSPVLANYRGERIPTKRYFTTSVIYSLALAFIFALLTYFSASLIPYFGFEEKLVPYIQSYLKICSLSVFGMYLYSGLKEFLQSFEIVNFPNIVAIFTIFFNILFNFAFIFGWKFIPSFGVDGLAIASVLTRTLMGLTVLAYCFNFLKVKIKVHKTYILDLLKVGYPISIALLLEFTAFNIITIILGKVSGLYASVNNIILTWAGITFMVPLAISNAIAVKVGYANGKRNYTEVKRISVAGVIMVSIFMSFCALCFLIFPKFLTSVFTQDETLIKIAIPAFAVVAAFQVVDGIQIALGGVLKGLTITKPLFLAVIIGYWGIGIPLGWILCFNYSLNIIGFWIGLATALFAISIYLSFILYKKLKLLKLTE